MSDYARTWFQAKVREINERLDQIYEAQLEMVKDSETPPEIRRDPLSERYLIVPEMTVAEFWKRSE